MAYCYKCGAEIPDDSLFCYKCGADLSLQKDYQSVSVSAATDSELAARSAAAAAALEDVRTDYYLILFSTGTCPVSYADDVIVDVLGYSSYDAQTIITLLPTEIASGLTAVQAMYIAQALTEYGMSVAVYNSDGCVDMGSIATESVYDDNGALKNTVLAVLGTLTASNLIRKFSKWNRLITGRHLFRPAYRKAPPVTWRRPRPVHEPEPAHRAVNRSVSHTVHPEHHNGGPGHDGPGSGRGGHSGPGGRR